MAKPDKQIKDLSRDIAGWTIVKVLPCLRTESVFTLELTKDGVTKQIDLFATDLGWWTEKTTTDHSWLSLKSGTRFCTECDINDSHPKVGEPCKMTHQDWDKEA